MIKVFTKTSLGAASGAAVKLHAFGLLLMIFSILHMSAGTPGAEDIQSRAAVAMDAETGRVLFGKNPDLKMLPASTTKLMTALIVVERANLSDVVTISRNAAGTAPTKSGLKAGDKVTIENLLYAALMKSANDAAVALAEAVAGTEDAFVRLMNSRAISLGASNTKFINANGLPGRGQYITAYDLAKIMRQAIKYPILKDIIGTRVAEVTTETGRSVLIRNTNRLLWADEDVLGGKTGFTRQARHCFVCAGGRPNETVIVALLGAQSRDMLWKETEELLSYGSKVNTGGLEPVVYITKSAEMIMDADGVAMFGVEKRKLKRHAALKKRGGSAVASARGGRIVKAKAVVKKAAVSKARKQKRMHLAKRVKDGSEG